MNIPYREFRNGDQIPSIGVGTFGSDKYSSAQVAAAVQVAAEVGYRHFDCASIYGNEYAIGEAFKNVFASGISREECWITSKVWNDMHDRVEESCERSLKDLRLDYLNLYLVHWPFPNHHAPGVGQDSRDPNAAPFNLDQYLRTWKQMEKLVERGLVRHIGTSNMTVRKLSEVIDTVSIRPEVNEMEMHPHFQQPKLFEYLKQNEILRIGFSPIGSPSRPERDRTAQDTVDTDDPVIVSIAESLNVSPAVVCILWQIKRGSIPIPFSVKRSQFEPILDAVKRIELNESHMNKISEIDKGCRLIKGQVFLWPSATDWTDLWDGEN